MNKKLISLVLLFGVLKAGILNADISYWPMFKYNTKRTGKSKYPGPDCCDEKWKFEGASSYYYSSPAVRIVGSDTMVYVGNKDNYFYAVADCGDHPELRWSYHAHNVIQSSPAIGSDGTIYVGDAGKYVLSIKQNGTKNWELSTGEYMRFSSPVIGSDLTIYIGSADIAANNDKSLYAVNPGGTLKWLYETGGWVNSSPALGSDGTIYIGSNDKKLYAMEDLGASGNCKWSYLSGGSICSTPAIASDGTIYFSAFDGYLYALNSDGTFKWTYFLSTNSIGNIEFIDIISSPAIGSDGTIYVGGKADTVHAVNPGGTRKWATGIPAFNPDASGRWNISSSPALGSNGYLYIGVGDYQNMPGRGGLALLKQSDGKFICGYCTPNEVWDSPAIGPNYTAYFGDCSGDKLYAIQCIPTGTEEEKKIDGIKLLDIYPNPFIAKTSIEYEIGKPTAVSMRIYDLCGRLVKVLVDKIQESGIHKVSWDGTNDSGKLLPRGIYYCTTQCDEKSVTRKLVLVR